MREWLSSRRASPPTRSALRSSNVRAPRCRRRPPSNPQLPPGSVELTLTIAGIGLLVVILAILVRGVRERIRREAVQPGAHAEAAASAAVQLAAAERAALSGDPRAALHAFYRYAILTLA